MSLALYRTMQLIRTAEEQLARLEAPRRTAEEAYSRADALIRQIDTLLRERKASELLRLGPTPLNPANWPTAAREVSGSVGGLIRETAWTWSNPERRETFRNGLPVILGLLFVSFFALHRLPRWLGLAARRLSRGRSTERRRQASQFRGLKFDV